MTTHPHADWYPLALGPICRWCDGTPEHPNTNDRGEPCACRCHSDHTEATP